MLIQVILEGRITYFSPFQGQAVTQLVASPGGMVQAYRQDPIHMFLWCGQGIGFWNRW